MLLKFYFMGPLYIEAMLDIFSQSFQSLQTLMYYCHRNNKKKKVMADLESFKTEIRKSGLNPEGLTLCNCEVR